MVDFGRGDHPARMSAITVTINGVPDILRTVQNLTPQLRTRLSTAIKATTLTCQTEAKRACPVGTPESTHKKGYVGGRLRASLAARFPDELTGEVFTNVQYGPYVELGTRKMRARPFLRPAFAANAAKLLERVKHIFQVV